jgi:hypothetical protein
MTTGSQTIQGWPEESQEAAQLVIDQYGEPDEATETLLTWHQVGAWKRIEASRTYYEHNFPAPHIDCVQSFIDYRVPPERVSDLATYDGSVVVDRTAGELSARCHDEQANYLALNLADDILRDRRTPREARAYYAREFLEARRGGPTPYMEKLHFDPVPGNAPDPDEPVLSQRDLAAAIREGQQR